MIKKRQQGFTLIELLIVIAIIAILAAVVFVALNPLKRFQDSRDSRRAADIENLLSAIKVHQVDNGGSYIAAISTTTAGSVYMIGTDSAGTADTFNTFCDTAVAGTSSIINLSGLVTAGYLGSIPVSPNGAGTWTAGHSGYTLTRASNGILTISACESEDTTEISTSR